MIAPSQGAHLVFDRSFLPSSDAILVPHTKDGRVMFALPWHNHTLVGTTDTPITDTPVEPVALDQEIEFMLETAGLYLAKKPTRADILSVFAGVRPLVKSGEGKNTAALSRDHSVHIDPSGLLTIAGGKWTTYRNMAEDAVEPGRDFGRSPGQTVRDEKTSTSTASIPTPRISARSPSTAPTPLVIRQMIDKDPALTRALDPELPYVEAEVIWAVREEMARTVEDVLARRTRALFLNAKAALRMAPRVAEMLAAELNKDAAWKADQLAQFSKVAEGYLVKA